MYATRYITNYRRFPQLLQIRSLWISIRTESLNVLSKAPKSWDDKKVISMARLAPSEKQTRMRQLVNNQPMSILSHAWDKCWVEGVTPWDIGDVTPIISHLIQCDLLHQGRALVPGCGTGYDVVAMANHKRYVVGIDISETAINQAQELATCAANSQYFEFLKEDFFTWNPSELFDLIFDYTFFCAIEPQIRPAWAKRIAELLKPDGELLTLMFPVSNHEGGPPYGVSVSKYEEVLHPYGFEAISIEDNEMAIEKRKGREILARWKRNNSHQSML